MTHESAKSQNAQKCGGADAQDFAVLVTRKHESTELERHIAAVAQRRKVVEEWRQEIVKT